MLEGSVHRAADRVRIGVELVDASTGAEMWTDHYDRPITDIFAVQDEIVGKVVTTLGLLFKLQEMKVPNLGPWYRKQNIEAFDDRLRAAEEEFRFTKDANTSARQWAQKVIDLDPKDPTGYMQLGVLYFESVLFQWSEDPQADLERSSELAEKALALDESNVFALALQCNNDWMQKRFDRAVAEGERAVAISPNYTNGYMALANAMNASNRPNEALDAAEKATRLDPFGRDLYAFFLEWPRS